MIFAIVVAVLAYRRANENGRSGILWALAGIAVFVGTQTVISVGAGILIGLGIGVFGLREGLYDDPAFGWPIAIVAIGASVFTSWLLLRYLDKPVDQEPMATIPPPPPPTFGQDG